uniref:Uncharacterized protein n=1 Tax=Arundo donax TaxID=35708 RepID=A0A0A9F017_ARUDO
MATPICDLHTTSFFPYDHYCYSSSRATSCSYYKHRICIFFTSTIPILFFFT